MRGYDTDSKTMMNFFKDAEKKFRRQKERFVSTELENTKHNLEKALMEIDRLKSQLLRSEQIVSAMKLNLEMAEAEATYVNNINTDHLLKIKKTLSFVRDAELCMQSGYCQVPSLLDKLSPGDTTYEDINLHEEGDDPAINTKKEKLHEDSQVDSNEQFGKFFVQTNVDKKSIQIPSPRNLFDDMDIFSGNKSLLPMRQRRFNDTSQNDIRKTAEFANLHLSRSPIISSVITPFKDEMSEGTCLTYTLSNDSSF